MPAPRRVLVLLSLITFPRPTQGLTHYPPAPDSHYDLAWAINGTGAPGHYDSSQTSDDLYGEYNWCSMPHVRAREYKVPPPEYSLRYVEVIQRHHKRTPYASNTFFREDISWDCSKEGPYAGAKSRDFDTTPVYWQSQRDSQNPFIQTVGPGFENSTCRFPSITSAGLEDSRQHGCDFASVYANLLHFLPCADETDAYLFRVTNNVITSQTLSGFARGVFPEGNGDLPYDTPYAAWIQSADYDSLEPSFSCPAASALNKAYEGTNPLWTEHLTASSAVRKRFDAVSGIAENDTAGWHISWDHPYDNLSAKQCHQLPLPCSVNSTDTCVSQDDANTIYRLGHYEYAYRWRGAANSTLYSALKMGAWFTELRAHLQTAAEGGSKLKYLHNFAHDGSISPVLGLLQIAYPVWPGMGSEVVFELWQNEDDAAHYVRVLWSGQPLQTSTPLGTLDMVKLEDFDAYLEDTIPADLVAACQE